MRRPLAAMAATTTLVLAACGGGDTGPEPDATETDAGDPTPREGGQDADDPGPDETTDADDVASWTFVDCDAERYTVSYPEDWHTTDGAGLLGACEVFHPEPIDEPEEPRDRDQHHAVSMDVDAVPFDAWLERDVQGEVLEERDVTVDGAPARVVEIEASGDGLLPEGERRYAYAVDLDGAILVAATHTVGETDHERDRQVLDRMMTEGFALEDRTAPVAGPATTTVSEDEGDGWSAVVTDLRVGAHHGFDRVVFEVGGDGAPGWRIEYVDEPSSQGSGHAVDVAGDAALQVTLRGIAYPMDAPVEPREGPDRLEPARTAAVRAVVDDSIYEGYQQFFVGVDEQRPYRVARLEDPQRIVIDIETG